MTHHCNRSVTKGSVSFQGSAPFSLAICLSSSCYFQSLCHLPVMIYVRAWRQAPPQNHTECKLPLGGKFTFPPLYCLRVSCPKGNLPHPQEVDICVRVVIRCAYVTFNEFHSNREYFSYLVAGRFLLWIESDSSSCRPIFCDSLTRIIINK